MKLYTIWRPPQPGEMPELYDAWDEYTIDANPSGYKDKVLAAGPRARVLIVTIPDKAATDLFREPDVDGAVQEAAR